MLPSSTSVRLQICLALPGTDTANSRLPLEVAVVEIVHPRCAGLDVSKRDAKCCVRVAGRGRAGTKSTVSTWGSVTNQVLALREHLIEAAVTLVVMEATSDYCVNARMRGLKVIIAGAGMSAALPGFAASKTDLPVIGVPISGKNLGGLDALLSAVQMPPGVPVGCVAIDGAKNAGLLAVRIINA